MDLESADGAMGKSGRGDGGRKTSENGAESAIWLTKKQVQNNLVQNNLV
jgi:hypothetical protein